MSLLLDALKKSEAQRRRGEPPAVDLAATPPSAPSGRAGRRWLMFLVPVLVLAAAAPWMWPQISSRFADGRAGDGVVEQTAGSAPEAGAERLPAPGESPPANRPAATVQDRVTPRAEPAPVAGAGRARSVASGDGRRNERPAARRIDAPFTATQQTQSATRQPATPAPDAGPGSQSGSQSGSGQAPASKSERVDGTESGSVSEPEQGENYIRAWELPQAQRAEFPELNLTVHFYSSSPRDRFVLVNGERYGEGQQIEPGVKLVEIRRRGAVIDFSGYRVLIE